MKGSLAGIICCTVALFGCNGEKKEDAASYKWPKETDSLMLRCDFRYDENTGTTEISAYASLIPQKDKDTFKGQRMEACRASKIINIPGLRFNDIELVSDKQNRFKISFKGYIPGGTIKWTLRNGNEFTTTIPPPVKVSFPRMRTFNKNFEMVFPFIGQPLKKDDRLQLSIKDAYDNFVDIGGGGHIKDNLITKNVNQTYEDGRSTRFLTRTSSSNLYKNGIRSSIESSYTTNGIQVEIVSKPEQTDPPHLWKGYNPY
jgi:hypothetical protein